MLVLFVTGLVLCRCFPCLCIFWFPMYCILFYIFSFVRCFAHACESFFLPLIGPLVYPGPLFMNQREQALARLRPLQAFKIMRDKLKGTMVFTIDSTWSSAAPCPHQTLPSFLLFLPLLTSSLTFSLLLLSHLLFSPHSACTLWL